MTWKDQIVVHPDVESMDLGPFVLKRNDASEEEDNGSFAD